MRFPISENGAFNGCRFVFLSLVAGLSSLALRVLTAWTQVPPPLPAPPTGLSVMTYAYNIPS